MMPNHSLIIAILCLFIAFTAAVSLALNAAITVTATEVVNAAMTETVALNAAITVTIGDYNQTALAINLLARRYPHADFIADSNPTSTTAES